MEPSFTHVSLFSGIGGFDLAADWAGFTTVLQVEKDEFCRRVLEKHWPGVTRIDDIRNVSANTLRRIGISKPTVLSGGFPCQPFSCAGLKRGAEDDRYLWPEMFRVIRELRPAWIVGENVSGFVNMELDTALADLEREGYSARAFVLPACSVNAPHPRFRCIVVAYAERPRGSQLGQVGRVGREQQHVPWNGDWKDAIESWSRRMDDGIPRRLDRLRALGNAVVPQQVFPFLDAIAKIEYSFRNIPRDEP